MFQWGGRSVFQMGGFIFKWWEAMGALALVREGG